MSSDFGLVTVLLPVVEVQNFTIKQMKNPFCFYFSAYTDSPVLSFMVALSFRLNRASVLLSMNSTTTDWIRTSMNAAVPLKQADSICLDLKNSQTTLRSLGDLLRVTDQRNSAEGLHHLRRLGAHTIARFLVCMFVTGLKVARWERCLMRNSRVLRAEMINIITAFTKNCITFKTC